MFTPCIPYVDRLSATYLIQPDINHSSLLYNGRPNSSSTFNRNTRNLQAPFCA